MGLSSSEVTRLKKRKAKIEEQLDALDDTIILLSSSPNESYQYDSGEGSQRAKKRKLDEALKSVQTLETIYIHICQKLRGVGIISVRARRDHR
jgi:hypothetical protein